MNNEVQKELVELCERAHESGFRHPGISGTICEKILIEQLKKEFPHLNFGTGVVLLSKEKGHKLKKSDYSSQIDIIVYKGNPEYEQTGFVAVHVENVFLVLEVKKWALYGDKGLSGYKKKIGEIREKIEKPILFVAFRFHGKTEKKLKNTLEEIADGVYVFSSWSKNNRYPWEIEPHYPLDEYRRLIGDIRSLTS